MMNKKNEDEGIVYIGLDKDNKIVVDQNVDMFEDTDDLKSLYMIVGILEKMKTVAMDVIYNIELNYDDDEQEDEFKTQSESDIEDILKSIKPPFEEDDE
tara:strand:- start:3726 stop:4022 length:297 start_codon:yes stop_codon:yes gene_type:complete